MCIVPQWLRDDSELGPVPLLEDLVVRIATPSVATWKLGKSSSFSVNPDHHANHNHCNLKKTTTPRSQTRPSRKTQTTTRKDGEREKGGGGGG